MAVGYSESEVSETCVMCVVWGRRETERVVRRGVKRVAVMSGRRRVFSFSFFVGVIMRETCVCYMSEV